MLNTTITTVTTTTQTESVMEAAFRKALEKTSKNGAVDGRNASGQSASESLFDYLTSISS